MTKPTARGHVGCATIIETPMPGTPHHCRVTRATFGELFDERYTTFDIMSDPITMFDAAARDFAGDREGTLITDRVPLYHFDDGEDHLDELVAKVRQAGWQTGQAYKRAASGWVTFTHAERATIHLGIRRLMTDDALVTAPGEEPTKDVALRLSRFHMLNGAAYRAMPGLSAIAALRNRYDTTISVFPRTRLDKPKKRAQPKWTWNHVPALHGRGDVLWERNVRADEAQRQWAYAFDVRAMYLAAAAGVRVGWNQPRHTGADVDWHPEISGFFRINAKIIQERRRGMVPLLNPRRIATDGTCWVTAPILAYVSETGLPMPEIIDSWTCDRSSMYLRSWAENIRDALPDAQTAGDERLRAAIKASYKEAVGLMGRNGGRVDRRDWHCSIIDEAAVRMIRKLDRAHSVVGILPMAIRTDCVWYASDRPDPLGLLVALGTVDGDTRIGQFKFDRKMTVPMHAYTTQRSKR